MNQLEKGCNLQKEFLSHILKADQEIANKEVSIFELLGRKNKCYASLDKVME